MLVKSQIKYIQSLSEKKVRDEDHVFVAEGEKIVGELLQEKRVPPQAIYALNGAKITPSDPRVPLEWVTEKEMERISFLSSPSTVLGVFKKPVLPLPDFNNELILMLDGIQDPGNLGTIIRSADWFGVKHIICSETTADCFNPKVVQATMGSIARVSVSYENLHHWCEQHNEIPRYAAMLHGESVKTINPLKYGVLIIGNESKGVSESLLQNGVIAINIPRIGQAESLNAAIATSIILSHLT